MANEEVGEDGKSLIIICSNDHTDASNSDNSLAQAQAASRKNQFMRVQDQRFPASRRGEGPPSLKHPSVQHTDREQSSKQAPYTDRSHVVDVLQKKLYVRSSKRRESIQFESD